MAKAVQPIPEGFNTLTPHLTVSNAAAAIAFYQKAFGATEMGRMNMPNTDKVMHAALRIGNSMLMLNDEFPEMGCTGPGNDGRGAVTIHLYVEDADAVFQQALDAGATVKMPIGDMFWGDRYGIVADPFGHHWSIATHTRDVGRDEMMAEMACTP